MRDGRWPLAAGRDPLLAPHVRSPMVPSRAMRCLTGPYAELNTQEVSSRGRPGCRGRRDSVFPKLTLPMFGPCGSPMRITWWLAVLTSLAAGSTAAQDKPDFSGQWILVSPADPDSNVAGELGVRQWTESKSPPGSTRVVTFTFLTIERQTRSGIRTESYQVGLSGGIVGGVVPDVRGSGPGGPSSHTRFRSSGTAADS